MLATRTQPGVALVMASNLLRRLGRLHEDGVHAEVGGHTGPLARLLEPDGGAGVRAGRDEDVLPDVDGGPQLGQPVLTRDDLLARHVAALLRPHLVLQEDAGSARLLVQLDRADGVERVPVAGVTVHHDLGVRHSAAHPAGDLGHLRLGEVPEVGEAEQGRRRAVPGEEQGVEAGGDGKAG